MCIQGDQKKESYLLIKQYLSVQDCVLLNIKS